MTNLPTEEEIVFKDRAIMHRKVNALKYLVDHLYLANKAVPERGIYDAGYDYGFTVYANGQIYHTRTGIKYYEPPTFTQIQAAEKYTKWQKEHPRYTEISVAVAILGVILASFSAEPGQSILLAPATLGIIWGVSRLFNGPSHEICYAVPLDDIISSATTTNMVKERIVVLNAILGEMQRFFMVNATDHWDEIYKNIPRNNV